jgi:uncharacterized protein YbbC (DUF1343 family)
MMIIRLLAAVLLSVLSLPCAAQGPRVQTGIEVLRERNFGILQGKRIGLITNHTAVDARLLSDIDILQRASGVKLVALFGPEHGVRGDHAAGDIVDSYVDPVTGIPVHSLYGTQRKPTAGMLQGLDVLVYDIQDIGCRSYTYISTMGLAMEAAAEFGVPFVVLDRPNPLGGRRIEGNIPEEGFFSFIGQFPIPYVYGLTSGELARLLNGEGMLRKGVRCSLTVVPMKGWNRDMAFEETGLTWVPTSPHVPQPSTPKFCVSTGVFGELGIPSIGIGYTLPFEVFAAQWIDPYRFARELNALNLKGIYFRPITFKPFYGPLKDSSLRGVQLHITDPRALNLLSLQYRILEVHHRLYPSRNPFALADSSRLSMFDKAAGTDRIRRDFGRRMLYADIEKILGKDVERFRRISEKYYLYK